MGILYAHENRVVSVNVSPDGTALASASWDCNIKVRFSFFINLVSYNLNLQLLSSVFNKENFLIFVCLFDE